MPSNRPSIIFHVSPEEKKYFTEQAKAAGMSLSGFMRKAMRDLAFKTLGTPSPKHIEEKLRKYTRSESAA